MDMVHASGRVEGNKEGVINPLHGQSQLHQLGDESKCHAKDHMIILAVL